MFETKFSHTSATPIPPNLSIENAIALLHDFETVIKLSPDCRGCKPMPSQNGCKKINGQTNGTSIGHMTAYEVEDDLPFIPKRLWSGGVKYRAAFTPVPDGCDITVYAPGGFTSENHWRLVRDHMQREEGDTELARVQSKDLLHASKAGSGWFVQIVSDASCSRTFAGFVKGFLKNSHTVQQQNFIERLQAEPVPRPKAMRRPTLGRRKSSVL